MKRTFLSRKHRAWMLTIAGVVTAAGAIAAPNEQETTGPAADASAASVRQHARKIRLAQAEAARSGDAAGSENNQLEQIIVTGSRIARSGFEAPSPITTLGAEQLQDLAVTNIGAAVSELPAFRASANPTTNGFGSFNVGAQIVNLRGLGVTRNLILLDNRRFAPTTREGSVDLNLIPSILIERTEVMTGGASAAYGSDAVAGAVNVILDKKLAGFRGQVDYGVSDKGDGGNTHAALAWGADYAAGRGHVVLGTEYSNQSGIGNCFERSWCTPGAIVTNGAFNTPAGVGNGYPNYVRSDTNAGFWMTSGGVVAGNNNVLIRNMFGTGGIQFDANGNPAPYTPGQIVSGIVQVGGEVVPTYRNTNLTIPVKRYTLFGHADLDFNDSLRGFFEASYGYVTGSVLQAAYFDTGISIRSGNPYIPANIQSIMTANAIATFTMGKLGDDMARGYSTSTADVWRATTGLNGKFGDSSWTWDAYYQYGSTARLQTVENNRIQANFTRAVNAVVDNEVVITPATGAIVCADTLSANAATRAAAAGCLPLNIFGPSNFNPAARAYAYGTLREEIDMSQHVLAANVQGDVANLPAGPVVLAGGVEARRDKMTVLHDPLSNQFAYFQNFGADYWGTSKVVEGYVQSVAPLMRDVAGAQKLDLDVAARYTRYDIDGFGSYLRANTNTKINATTWKGSLIWEPVEWLRLRGTRSRDIRAPNFADMYLASASSFAPISNRFITPNPNQIPTNGTVSGGSPNLNAERSNTTTIGLVFSPAWGWTEGLRLSVDYFDIAVNGYIAAPGAQFIMDRCFAGVTQACNYLTLGAGNALVQVRNVSINLDELSVRGADIEAEYRWSLESAGDLSLRLLATHMEEFTTQTFGIAVDRAGQTGGIAANGAPDWLMNAYVTYKRNPLSVTLQARYIDSGVIDAQRFDPSDSGYAPTLANSANDNHVASAFYLNLFGNYDLPEIMGKSMQVFAAVNNVLDRAPPFAPETQYPTNPTYFDQIGRTYRLGLRAKF